MEMGTLTPAQQQMLQVWQQHQYAEFVLKDVDGALATMVEDPYVLMVPTGLGGSGRDGVRSFYAERFIPHLPTDIAPAPVSQVIGHDRIVDESVFTFTHDCEMAWLLPGVAATGRKVQISVVGVVQFRDGKVANEHLHYDHAGLLAQLGLIEDDPRLAIGGAAAARKLLE